MIEILEIQLSRCRTKTDRAATLRICECGTREAILNIYPLEVYPRSNGKGREGTE